MLIGALAVLNIRGSQESAKLNLVLAIADLATQVVLVGIGLFLVLSPEILVDNVHLGVAPTWSDFALGIAVGMIAYTGIETISNMAEEAKDASRTIPRSVGLTVIAVLALYLLIPVVALSAMPVTENAAGQFTTALGTEFANDPILGIVENLGLGAGMTDALRFYVGILAAVILLIATNAGLIGVSRLTYSMGQHRQLPEVLRQVHPRYRTPYVAILIFSVVAAITLLPGKTDFLATMYSFGAMLSFTIAHVSVIQLRRNDGGKRQAHLEAASERARLRLRRAAHRGAGRAGHVRGLDRGDGAQSAHAGGRNRLDGAWHRPLRPLPAQPEAASDRDGEGAAARAAGRGGDRVPQRPGRLRGRRAVLRGEVATAVKLASKRRRGHPRPLDDDRADHLPLDAELPEQETEAQSKIEQAKLIGGQRVTGHVERVRPGQAGYSIADEATLIKAAAAVIGLRYRNGAPLYDKTLQTVLGERPCRVIVVSDADSRRIAGVAPP